jgi:hypothetical protein
MMTEKSNQTKVKSGEVQQPKKPDVSKESRAGKRVGGSAKPAGEAKTTKAAKSKKRRLSFRSSILVVTVINILVTLSLVFILSNLNTKAKELKKARSVSIGAEQKSKVEIADLEIQSTIEKSSYLFSLFPDESGLVNFIKEIEKLKTEGVVTEFSFASEDAVRDKTKVLGIPFVLRMEGSWEQINKDLKSLQEMPFLQRAITISTEVRGEEEKVIDFRYGGFIYVDESLKKD